MDAFLRRVMELREVEQECGIVAVAAERLIHCRCGTSLQERHGDTLCTNCRRAENQRKGNQMAEETSSPVLRGKPCAVCGKPTRSDNTRGYHTRCFRGAGSPEAVPTDRPLGGGKTDGSERDVKKRFRAAADALGFDADEILERHMRDWLARAKEAVRSRATPEDDFKLPSERDAD